MERISTTGTTVRALRIAAGISQRELSERVGCSHTQIARYEQGAEPTLPVARRLADALGCTLDDLAATTAAVGGGRGCAA